MKNIVDLVTILTTGAVFIAGLMFCGWPALLVEGLIALVYIICKII